ncbi:hypothetical protein IWX49DRAFT_145374 [Phyllosticta citricarpa]|uniref:RWD domain-containing protein n=2 Tax=Phyllosticta TaxID=121621 RepID=A0ABR1M7R3_9PEZI
MGSDAQDGHVFDASENRERQRNEIALLESMYPEEFLMIKDAQSLEEDIEFEIKVDASHTLSFIMPASYPESSHPQVFLSFGEDIENDERRHFRAILRDIIQKQELGIECVDLIIGDLRLALEDVKVASDHALKSASKHSNEGPTVHEPEGLRVVLWMHHLLATSKRRAIVQMSRESCLAGYSRPGYPGSVYVEGEADNVRSFVDELKTMRWQAIQERASESCPMSALTLISAGMKGIQEVQGLGEMAEGLKSHGEKGSEVASFYLESMKIK